MPPDMVNMDERSDQARLAGVGGAGPVVEPLRAVGEIAQTTAVTTLNLMPAYILIVMVGAAITLALLRVAAALNGLRREQRMAREAEQMRQNAALYEQRRRDIADSLGRPDGIAAVLAQIIADATGDTIALDLEAGLLSAAALPAPRFAVRARDGREFVFTTQPASVTDDGRGGAWHALLRRLTGEARHTVIDVSDGGIAARIDAQSVWSAIAGQRKFTAGAVTPREAAWWIVVRLPRADAARRPFRRQAQRRDAASGATEQVVEAAR